MLGSLIGCLGEPAPLPPDQALIKASESISRILAEDQAFSQRAADRTNPPDSARAGTNPVAIQFWAFTHPLVSRAMTRNMFSPPAMAPATAGATATKDSCRSFKALHPEIQLNYLHIGEWELAIQKLTVTMAAGDLPDVALIKRDWLPRLAEVGLIAPLDTILPAALRDDLREPIRASLTYHDLLYAFPADGFCSILFSNRELIPQPPRNWDALQRCLTALAASDPRAPATVGSLPFLEMLWSAGGEVCRNNTCELQSDAAKETMAFFSTLQREKRFVYRGMIPAQTGLALLTNHQAAMTVASSDVWPQLRKAPVPVQCSPIPGKNGPISRLSDNIIVVFSRHAMEKAEAITKLLDYLTGNEVQGMAALEMGSVPVRKSILAICDRSPEALPLDETYRNGKTPSLVFSWNAIESELNRNLDLAFRWDPDSLQERK